MALPVNSVSVTTPAKIICTTLGIWGGLNPSFFVIWGLSPPSPYVEPPLTPCIHNRMLFFTFLRLALCSRNSEYYIRSLFLFNSSLHKQPFITAHFRSSLH